MATSLPTHGYIAANTWLHRCQHGYTAANIATPLSTFLHHCHLGHTPANIAPPLRSSLHHCQHGYTDANMATPLSAWLHRCQHGYTSANIATTLSTWLRHNNLSLVLPSLRIFAMFSTYRACCHIGRYLPLLIINTKIFNNNNKYIYIIKIIIRVKDKPDKTQKTT
jgi:hypothetical protein